MILLGIGTNLGNREVNLTRALQAFPAKGIEFVRRSRWYESPPWGILDQPGFLNGVCEVAFQGEAEELLDRLLEIEKELGRVREQKWGPRLIDLDILEFDRRQVRTESLVLPHPFYHERAFVLVPLAELEPGWVPTGREESVEALIARLGKHGVLPYVSSKPFPTDS